MGLEYKATKNAVFITHNSKHSHAKNSCITVNGQEVTNHFRQTASPFIFLCGRINRAYKEKDSVNLQQCSRNKVVSWSSLHQGGPSDLLSANRRWSYDTATYRPDAAAPSSEKAAIPNVWVHLPDHGTADSASSFGRADQVSECLPEPLQRDNQYPVPSIPHQFWEPQDGLGYQHQQEHRGHG
ncbi:hypothetical protein PR048_011018 [Dryococelus australis]|uniref:Uncharacterized protein n=1 Tax=Dryococelus australis TaxID=614101 RepID=A0ABQ9HKH4_9NEOP|nr:hypothetical protein PR048_011018 [Dryococelus australis]